MQVLGQALEQKLNIVIYPFRGDIVDRKDASRRGTAVECKLM
jgi:hypothetical protein